MNKKNPANMLKTIVAMNQFRENHPKFAAFLKTALGRQIPEGTIIEVSIERPGEQKITSNLRVKQSDLELLEELRNRENRESNTPL